MFQQPLSHLRSALFLLIAGFGLWLLVFDWSATPGTVITPRPSHTLPLWGADSVLGAPESLVRRAYTRECGAAAADLALGPGVESRPWVDVLDAMSVTCPDNTSFLPLAGREVWHRHADAAILAYDTDSIDARLADGCDGRKGAAAERACIFFADSHLTPAASGAALAFLDSRPRERLVMVSSSNHDNCMPGAADERVARLLAHPRFGAWFTENVCEAHPAVHPLPLGPKFRTDSRFGRENVRPVRKKYLAAVRGAVAAAAAGRRRRGLFMRVSEGTSSVCAYRPALNMRQNAKPHLIAVAAELDALATANASLPAPPQAAEYLEALSESRLCWSPPGAGLDVHRTWEALLVSTPPVVLRSPLSPLHAPLPVVEVADFGAVTAAGLEEAAAALEQAFPALREARPVPEVWAFTWLARIEAEAARFPPGEKRGGLSGRGRSRDCSRTAECRT